MKRISTINILSDVRVFENLKPLKSLKRNIPIAAVSTNRTKTLNGINVNGMKLHFDN